ncbi:ABC transporter ATP-binding protein [Ktedonospora formicarum]|uniref:Sugar ABC transporter ATP-binding protein n=1 Tax=Ktedonospora formicarum TaxID=2778364 RepID=A0A8J3HV34_9CHLR|nr:ABC transporter ATP-binding protein [Ktedonospora formicarum]GHO44309.1 sugar ABC transporter ATP-binding protein [Ktedonospora formicarum]
MQESTLVKPTQESDAPYAVEMRDISKIWPGVIANDRANLTVRQGEIHALMGENGAGKSTLMNILYGLIHPDGGKIFVKGQEVSIHGPRDAMRLGIGMVHQHFMLIPPLTVAENIILGREPGGLGGTLSLQQARTEVKSLGEQYGLPINPDAKIKDLSVGLQQRVEILKVLARGADILIMDEPTGVLTPQETDELFSVLRSLVKQGKTIIFITHKLREVLELTDNITVLRRGKNVGNLATSKTDRREIARMMVGRDVLLQVVKEPAQPGAPILQLKDLCAKSDLGLEVLHNINLEVRSGEILGIAGVEGNGQSELVEVISGMRKCTTGEVTITPINDGKPGQTVNLTNMNASDERAMGLAHIPEDRRESGLVLSESIADNMILGRQRWPEFAWKCFALSLRKIGSVARKLAADFDVRTPSVEIPVKALSGGNQQKVIIARELSCNPQALIASQPTRGVDIGAIEFIHRRLIEQRDAGKAVLLVSAELDEIRSLSDRVAVMYEGRIVDIVSPDTSDEEMGVLMTGGAHHDETTQGPEPVRE